MDLEALFRTIPCHFENWTNSNVIQWLEYIYLERYSPTFSTLIAYLEEQKITGIDLIYLTNIYL